MRLLLDTCTFLWLCTEPTRLSPTAAAAIEDEQNELFLGHASIWEITLKYKAAKLPLPDLPRRWIPAELQFHAIQAVLISMDTLFLAGELPGEHRDPFDRMIAAHAVIDSFKLVSPDHAFQTLGIDCLW